MNDSWFTLWFLEKQQVEIMVFSFATPILFSILMWYDVIATHQIYQYPLVVSLCHLSQIEINTKFYAKYWFGSDFARTMNLCAKWNKNKKKISKTKN